MKSLSQPSLIAKAEIYPGIKGGVFAEKVWRARNLALWAISPPHTRCLTVKLTNYDYIPIPVKSITISTGDPRENLKLENKNAAPIHHIPVGGHHQWAFDAVPIFTDIALNLYEARMQKKEKKTGMFSRFYLRIWALMRSKLNPMPRVKKIPPALKQKIQPAWDEIKLHAAAFEDFIEEIFAKNKTRLPFLQNEFVQKSFFAGQKALAGFFKKFFQWWAHFLRKFPAFLMKVLAYAIKSTARGFWRAVKRPFEKFNPMRRKKFRAIIELQNGQRIKTRASVGVSLFFIEKKIMPLVFSASELSDKEDSSSEFLQALFDLLQIRNQPV